MCVRERGGGREVMLSYVSLLLNRDASYHLIIQVRSGSGCGRETGSETGRETGSGSAGREGYKCC